MLASSFGQNKAYHWFPKGLSYSWAFRRRGKAHEKLVRSQQEKHEKPVLFQLLLASISILSFTNEDLACRKSIPLCHLLRLVGLLLFGLLLDGLLLVVFSRLGSLVGNHLPGGLFEVLNSRLTFLKAPAMMATIFNSSKFFAGLMQVSHKLLVGFRQRQKAHEKIVRSQQE